MDDQLPSLPLVPNSRGEPCLLIDNSATEQYMECGRKWEYSFLRKRVAVNSAAPLNFGAGIHHALKHRFTELAKLNYVAPSILTQEEHKILDEHFAVNPQPLGQYRTPTFAKNLVEEYNKVYEKEVQELVVHDGKPQVEVSFAHDLGYVDLPYNEYIEFQGKQWDRILIVWMGRIDAVLRDSMGIWVMDHKTAFMFGDNFWAGQEMSFQCKGYVWAYEQSYGVRPVGYGIDAIRTRKPGKGDEFVSETGVRRDDLKRDFFLVSPEQIVEWKRNALSICEEIVFNHQRGYLPRRSTACVGKYGKCPYIDVCRLPIESRLPMLMSGEYVDNNWSPLNNTSDE